jgi:hypothetical protein
MADRNAALMNLGIKRSLLEKWWNCLLDDSSLDVYGVQSGCPPAATQLSSRGLRHIADMRAIQ